MIDLQSPEDLFDFDGYLEWQEKRQEGNGDGNTFMHEFIKTQTFHEFIEHNYHDEEGNAENAAVFFDSCIELHEESTIKKLKAEIKSKKTSLSRRKLDDKFDEQYWADAQLSVKQLFFNFLLLTVNNYIRFYRTNQE